MSRLSFARRLGVVSCFALLAWLAQPAGLDAAQPARRPAPTLADVPYGAHPQNVLDFWKADAARPAPLVIYIHGGGFRGGSKNGINVQTLRALLDAGIHVAAVEYRFVSHAPLPAAHHDCRRALQFLRSKAAEWNIDKQRIGAFGGSAGAQLCMYLAMHDDMADPNSDDPIQRESTRLACVATSGGQTTMDIEWWLKHIPGYDQPHRNFYEAFGVSDREAYLNVVRDISALSLASSDDPPIFMTYGMAPGDPPPSGSRAQGWKVHHVAFGIALKKKLDELGVEAHLKHPGAQCKYDSAAAFFIDKLKQTK